MTSDRAYRRARSPEVALAELCACAGAQFDPAVVEAFLRMRARARAAAQSVAPAAALLPS